MPLRRGRSSKAKTSLARAAPLASSTAAGWDSEDDLLADDPSISAVSAFPDITSDEHEFDDGGLLDPDPLETESRDISKDAREPSSPVSSSEVSSTARPSIVASAAADTQTIEEPRISEGSALFASGDDDVEAPTGVAGETVDKDDDDDDDDENASSNVDPPRGSDEVAPAEENGDADADEMLEEKAEYDVGRVMTDDAAADDELDYDFEDLPDSPEITLGEDKGDDVVEAKEEASPIHFDSADDERKNDEDDVADPHPSTRNDSGAAEGDAARSVEEEGAAIEGEANTEADGDRATEGENGVAEGDNGAADGQNDAGDSKSSESARRPLAQDPKDSRDRGESDERDDERKSLSDDDDDEDDDDDDRDCRRRRRRKESSDHPRVIETRVSRGLRDDMRRRDVDRWRYSPPRAPPHRRSPPRINSNRVHPLDQFLSMTSGPPSNKIHINPRFMTGNSCPPLMNQGVPHSSPSRSLNQPRSMGPGCPPPPGTMPVPINLPLVPPIGFDPSHCRPGGPGPLPMGHPMNNPPPFFSPIARPPPMAPPFFNPHLSPHPNPLFRLPYVPGGFGPPPPTIPSNSNFRDPKRRSPSPPRRGGRRSRSRSRSPRRARSSSPNRKRTPPLAAPKKSPPKAMTPEELEYQKKLDEQKKLRAEVLRKKEANRLKAVKQKEAEMAARATARNASSTTTSSSQRSNAEILNDGRPFAAPLEARGEEAQRRPHSPPHDPRTRPSPVTHHIPPQDSRIRPPPQDSRIRPPPQDSRIRPPPQDSRIRPPPQDSRIRPPPQDSRIRPPPQDSRIRPPPPQESRIRPPPPPPQAQQQQQRACLRDAPVRVKDEFSRGALSIGALPRDRITAPSAHDSMPTQRRPILEDPLRQTTEVGKDYVSPAIDGVAPSPTLTHAVLNAPSIPITTKKVAVVKRKPVLPPTEGNPLGDVGAAEDSESASRKKHNEIKRDLPLPLRPKAAASGPKPSLPDLPLPSLEVPKSPPKKEPKRKLKIVNVDNATGIITTADGWKLRAKMVKITSEDGAERVVKKYIKVDDRELQQIMPPEQQSWKRSSPPQSNDLSSNASSMAPSRTKLQRITAPGSALATTSSTNDAKQPLSTRFHRLQRNTADAATKGNAPSEVKTCFVILSNLGESINDLKIKDLCNRVGPIFSIQYRKSEGRALVKFKKPEDAKAFSNQYDSRIFENQRIKVHLRSPTRR